MSAEKCYPCKFTVMTNGYADMIT